MLVAIEGIDGSGKGTQAAMLVERLAASGADASLFAFPTYKDTFFGGEIGRYLNGEYGRLGEVDPRFAVMLYAANRYEKAPEIRRDLAMGKIVVCDRYVPSNICHQCAQLPTDRQDDLSGFIERMEYIVYGIPKPDLVCVLDMPPAAAQEMVLKKKPRGYTDKKQDMHEGDLRHLTAAHEAYGRFARSRGWKTFKCTDPDGAVRPVQAIGDELFAAVSSAL